MRANQLDQFLMIIITICNTHPHCIRTAGVCWQTNFICTENCIFWDIFYVNMLVWFYDLLGRCPSIYNVLFFLEDVIYFTYFRRLRRCLLVFLFYVQLWKTPGEVCLWMLFEHFDWTQWRFISAAVILSLFEWFMNVRFLTFNLKSKTVAKISIKG